LSLAVCLTAIFSCQRIPRPGLLQELYSSCAHLSCWHGWLAYLQTLLCSVGHRVGLGSVGDGKHSGAGQSPGRPGPDRCLPNGLQHSVVVLSQPWLTEGRTSSQHSLAMMTVSGQLDTDSIEMSIRSESQRIEGFGERILIAELPSVEEKANGNGC
jgi:hypothetical protein